MLALTVREGDYVTIGDDIVVQVLKTGDIFRIAMEAPKSMYIRRAMLQESVGEVPACIQQKRRQEAPKGPNYRRTRVLR